MSDDSLNETAIQYATHSPYARLIDELYKEEVLSARKMSPEHKFLLGESLFLSACRVTLSGIRNQNPLFSETDCLRELERRLKWRERLDWQK